MKKILTVLAAAVFASAFAEPADTSSAIVRLLNSRAAGSPRAYTESALAVAKAAEEGRPLQQFVIAVMSEDADFPREAKISESKRQEYFANSRDRIRQLAEEKGNSLAWYLLSLEKNDLKLLKRAADGGNVQALNAWGTITLTEAIRNPGVDTNNVEKILVRSFGYFKRAADQGDPNGFYNLGMCHLHGYGCVRNQDLAFECFRSAAATGHPEAINNIGGFFRDGIVVEKNLETAVKWFAKSSKMGNAFGQLNYALALLRGEGVEKDVKLAASMLKDAAEQGNAEAMNAYGMCFSSGSGVDKDEAEAVKWFVASARLGFPPAMDNLSSCYDLGLGVRKDASEAMVWKIRGRAARGDRNAATWLRQNGHSMR